MEFDLHVWKKAEDEDTVALYTLSVGKRAVVIDATVDGAVKAFRRLLEEEAR